MGLKRNDWLIIIGFVLITILPLLLRLFDWGQKNYDIIVFFAGFLPIFTVHSTQLGLRFRNKYFSILWILVIGLNGLLYYQIYQLWIALTVSFIFYNLLRLIFKYINKEDPIPMLVGPGFELKYNIIESRMENGHDIAFTMISFFVGNLFSTIIFVVTK